VNPAAAAKVWKRAERWSAHHSTSGGSSDTEANELTVMTMGRRSALSAVWTTTPVGKHPSALRNARALNRMVRCLGTNSALACEAFDGD
jgi:hypothetical protein